MCGRATAVTGVYKIPDFGKIIINKNGGIDILTQETPLGDKVSITYTNRTTEGTEGIINTSRITYDVDGTLSSISITVFGFTLTEGSDNIEIKYGMTIKGYGGSAGISLKGLTSTVITPNSENNTNLLTGTFRPGGGVAALAIVALFAPEALPSIIFGATKYIW